MKLPTFDDSLEMMPFLLEDAQSLLKEPCNASKTAALDSIFYGRRISAFSFNGFRTFNNKNISNY
jgi:hypothetical protein